MDVRRAGRVVVAVCLVDSGRRRRRALRGGVHKNAQINGLRRHGVAVTVTVSRAVWASSGGSGSNPAGYACQGTFALDGRRYTEAIPGNVPHRPGTKIRRVAVSGDPPLSSTAHAVATERASASVFLVPAILLVVLLVLVRPPWS